MSVNIKVTGGLNIEWGQCDPKVTGGLTGNTAEEVFNVVIVNRRFVLFIYFKYRFRLRYRFKSSGLAPVSKKNKTIPIPTLANQRLYFKTGRVIAAVGEDGASNRKWDDFPHIGLGKYRSWWFFVVGVQFICSR